VERIRITTTAMRVSITYEENRTRKFINSLVASHKIREHKLLMEETNALNNNIKDIYQKDYFIYLYKLIIKSLFPSGNRDIFGAGYALLSSISTPYARYTQNFCISNLLSEMVQAVYT
jgi:hypothetical protein